MRPGCQSSPLRRHCARVPAAAAGIAYAFKYSQQVEGDLVLPRGSRPVQVVRLLPEGGAALEQAFPWSAVVAPAQADG